MKQKKILYCIDGLGIGGAERVVVQLATGMQARGYDVHVVAVPRTTFVDSDDQSQRASYDELLRAKIPVSVIPKRRRFSIRFLLRLIALCKELRPDIVHTHLFTGDTFGVLAAFYAKVPCILSTEHSINYEEGFLKTLCKGYLHRFHRDVACVSLAVKKYIQHYGGYARRYALPIIYNAVDLQSYPMATVPDAQGRPLVMTIVGRLVAQKGHIRFLNIFSQLHADVHLRIVGSGPLKDKLLQEIQHLGLGSRVSIESARSDVDVVYKESDIVIIPSLWEGFGIVAIEAQAAGVPVIASAVDGLREVVRDRVTGRCVDFSDSATVIRACEELIRSAELRRQYGLAGREYTQKMFSIERMLDSYESWYERYAHSSVGYKKT